MNKHEFVYRVAESSGLTKTQALKAVESFVEVVADALRSGDDVRLIGFGTFDVVVREARQGRNPRTGEIIQIQASKLPRFKAGQPLKDALMEI